VRTACAHEPPCGPTAGLAMYVDPQSVLGSDVWLPVKDPPVVSLPLHVHLQGTANHRTVDKGRCGSGCLP
jgi:hypothetical protein